MNCRPNQRAWVKVPPSREHELMGLTALNGQVVTTLQLQPDAPAAVPTWLIEPNLEVRVRETFINVRRGDIVFAGTKLVATGLPDAWLRPFNDFPPEELADANTGVQERAAT